MVEIRDEFSRLVRIAEQTVGAHHVKANHRLGHMRIYGDKLYACQLGVGVKSEEQWDLGMELAQKFERELGTPVNLTRAY